MKKPQKNRNSKVFARKPRSSPTGRSAPTLQRSHALPSPLAPQPSTASWSTRLIELELRAAQLELELERARAEAAHHQAQADSLAALINAAPVGLVTLGPFGGILSVNHTAQRLLCRTRTDLLKSRFQLLVAHEDVAKFDTHLRQVRSQAVPFTSELLLRGIDAEHRIPVQLSSLPVTDDQRRVTQVLVSIVDISAYKSAEHTLRASEQSLRSLIKASPHPAQLKDANCRWQLANAAVLEIFDLQGIETRGLTTKDIAERAPHYRGALLQRDLCDRDVLLTGTLDRRDEIILKPDGSARILDVIRVPVRDHHHHITGLVVLGYDITERFESDKTLRQNEERHQLILDSTLDAVVTTNAEGNIIGWNPQAEQLFGLPKAAALGRKLSQTTIPPERRAAYEGEMREYLATSGGAMLKKRVETTALGADGHIFPVEISVTSAIVRGEINFTAFIRDITERRAAERRLAGLLAINRLLARSSAIAEAVPKLLQTICEVVHFEFGALWMPVDGSATSNGEPAPPLLQCDTIYQVADSKLESFGQASAQFTFARGHGLPGRVWESVAPVWIPDVSADTNFPRAAFAAKDGLVTGFGFPILAGHEFLGVMEFFTREKREADDTLFGTVHGIGSQIGQFLERRRADAAVRHSEHQLRLARDQLADANKILDHRVHERTAELSATNAALQQEIRARAQAERARLRLAAIVESSFDAIASRSLDGTITSWNKAAERIFGWSAFEIVGQPSSTIIPEERAEEIEEAVQCVTNGEMVEPFETVARRKDGRAFHVSIALSPVRDDEEIVSGISAIIRDITERKELQNEVLRIAEREQRRIAQDLHDGLGQQLAGISCLTNALKKDLAGQSSAEAKTAARISTLLDSAVEQTRGLARGLLPVSIEPGGLMLALSQLARHLSGLFKVRCHFDCPAPVEVADSTLAAHFFRIAQEAATNSIKHGRARDIVIGLSSSPERTILAVTDDGVGIRQPLRRSKGLGLRIMRHRAGVIGGSLVIQKREGGGTEVICAVEMKGTNGHGQT